MRVVGAGERDRKREKERKRDGGTSALHHERWAILDCLCLLKCVDFVNNAVCTTVDCSLRCAAVL